MEITLSETRAVEVKLSATTVRSDSEINFSNPLKKSENTFNLGFETLFPKTGETSEEKPYSDFAVLFNCTIKSEHFEQLEVGYLVKFVTSERFGQEFKGELFVKINAPAIGYPYLRAFIGQLMVLSGYPPFTLPTINFVQLHNQNQQKQAAEAKLIEGIQPKSDV